MMINMDMLQLRKKLKSKKPKFMMTGVGERKRVKAKWRLARGSDNKIRANLKGYPKRVKIGYGSPKEAKGLHPTGLVAIVISNISELGKVDKKTMGAIISGKIGDRKRAETVKKCQEMGIRILNLKAEEYLNKVSAEMSARKEGKKKKAEEKEKKKKDKEKKASEKEKSKEKKEAKEESKDAAEKIEAEKEKQEQEKQKVLTKKE
jgi:large subunit ribosomal protein L32e